MKKIDKHKEREFKKFVEEVIYDIALFGVSTTCYVYLTEDNLIDDYSLEREKILYMDETVMVMTLFELLFLLINADYAAHEVFIPLEAILIKTIRQVTNLSTAGLANLVGESTQAIEEYEQGVKKIGQVAIISFAKACNIPSDIILRILYE